MVLRKPRETRVSRKKSSNCQMLQRSSKKRTGGRPQEQFKSPGNVEWTDSEELWGWKPDCSLQWGLKGAAGVEHSWLFSKRACCEGLERARWELEWDGAAEGSLFLLVYIQEAKLDFQIVVWLWLPLQHLLFAMFKILLLVIIFLDMVYSVQASSKSIAAQTPSILLQVLFKQAKTSMFAHSLIGF